MNNMLQKEIAEDIKLSYISVIETGLEESPNDFIYTRLISDFTAMMREKGIGDNINDVFTDKFLDKMYVETSKYLSR